jgi:hypothetical protein
MRDCPCGVMLEEVGGLAVGFIYQPKLDHTSHTNSINLNLQNKLHPISSLFYDVISGPKQVRRIFSDHFTMCCSS